MRQTENDMKKSRYSESQIVKILKEVEGGRLFDENWWITSSRLTVSASAGPAESLASVTLCTGIDQIPPGMNR